MISGDAGPGPSPLRGGSGGAGDRLVGVLSSAPAEMLARVPQGQRVVAFVLVPWFAAFMAGVRYAFANGVTVALLVGLALAPVWLTYAARFRGVIQILLIGVLAIVAGIALTASDPLRETATRTLMLPSSFQLMSILCSIGLLLWARGHLGAHRTAVAYGLGLVVSVVVTSGVNEINGFKFSFSIPIAVIALGLAGLARTRAGQIMWMVALILVMLLFADSRSMVAVLAMTLVLTIWQMASRGDTTWRARPWTTLMLLVLFGLAVFQAMQAVILEGVLGESAKQRSELQIETAGSVVVGGRPELGATLALLRRQPWGYGTGVVPTSSDVWNAKIGMHALNYDPNNGYVSNYMFSSGFEVHSVLGDLWIRYGIFGGLLALSLVGYCVYSLAARISTRSASPLIVFLVVNAGWDLLFTPLHTASNSFVLALALAAIPKPGLAPPPRPAELAVWRGTYV